MGNSLGAGVFLAAAAALGYWVVTGRANAFLAALNNARGSQGSSAPTNGPLSTLPGASGPLQDLQFQQGDTGPDGLPVWHPVTVGGLLFNE